jgi:phosphoribosyl-ATP pyrophosphohydrolase
MNTSTHLADRAPESRSLGEVIDDLVGIIASRVGGDPQLSYTASLLNAGPGKCAKKLGEEGVEAALAAVSGDKAALASEAADVLFHLLVTLQVCGVTADEAAAALHARKGVSGHDEKKQRSAPGATEA